MHQYAILSSSLCDSDTAERMLKKALKMNPDFAKAHKDLGIVYLNKRLFDYAEDEFKTALELAPNDFEILFEAILTDRDPKFNCFKNIEVRDDNAVIRTRIFFCNPGASNEKPLVENLNQQIRVIFPKGCLLSNITQDLCDEISSNLNSRYLNSIDGTTPSELFIKYFGEEIFKKLNLKVIKPNDVRILKYNKY